MLPRAKICVQERDFEKAFSEVSLLMDELSFKLLVDSSKHENIRDIHPAFSHWQRADGVNLSLDDYTKKGFVQINVYEEKDKFSDRSVQFYTLLSEHMASTYGNEAVYLMLTPVEVNQGKVGSPCKY